MNDQPRDFKRLYRSREETQLTGLCGGLGLYFGIDPVVIRLLWVVATVMTGIVPGVAAYLLGWLVVPLEPQRVVYTPPPAQPVTPTQEQPQP